MDIMFSIVFDTLAPSPSLPLPPSLPLSPSLPSLSARSKGKRAPRELFGVYQQHLHGLS